MVHSAEDGSIPVPDNLAVITELQAVALAIRMFGLDGLDKVIVRRRNEGAESGVVSPILKAKAQGG
ncbi:hypothetical protein [Brevundimonas sp.]|uniref:hypothetical protein n=1 Tax=Brevundimonas sp. TaxID=1871086 RepID=UPI002EDADAE1